MKLSKLINAADGCEVTGGTDVEVRDLAYSVQDVKGGSCFVAIRGRTADGHDFVPKVISQGAVAIVSERPVDVSDGVANAVVPNSRRAMAQMSSRFFGDPTGQMRLVGVTGTNGKTTITYLLEAILNAAGWNPGVIGTVSHRYAGTVEPARHTTPESVDLQRLFSKMLDSGVDSCAMEVSSHALAQDRVAACRFDCAVFTNLTPEHLDYHGQMDSYFAAKAILFEELILAGGKPEAFAVINGDDPYGREIARRCLVPKLIYGFGERSDVRGSDLRFSGEGLEMKAQTPGGTVDLRSKLCGRFNALNILAATSVAWRWGISLDVIRLAVGAVEVVPGRFEVVSKDRDVLALVDYAHTPDALENVLTHARELKGGSDGRLIAVFGCGGDRDRMKRPLMGKVVGRLADVVIVTSDNPRSEDPVAIIDEIIPGVKEEAGPLKDGRGYDVVVNRHRAIARAVDLARPGDVIVVAGKGHENYQIIGSRRLHFDDRQVLGACLNG